MARRKAPSHPKPQRRSLADFIKDKKRANCRVCSLPEDVRAELRTARSKDYRRAVVIEWLKVECGVTLTGADFDSHNSARHE